MKTTNYDQFTFFPSNRPIIPGKVARFKETFKSIGYIEQLPILTTKDKKIIDGQHRFLACKELQMPVHFSVITSDVDPEILMIDINRNQDVWRLYSYVHHYAEQGVRYYQVLRDFESNHKMGISNTIAICSQSSVNVGNEMRSGKNRKLNDDREKIAEYILSFNDLFFFKNLKFTRSIVSLYKKAKKEDLKKLHAKRLSITQQPSELAYLNVYTNIINKGRPDKNRIAF